MSIPTRGSGPTSKRVRGGYDRTRTIPDSYASTTAFALALLMAFAAVFHFRRPGETPNLVFNIALGVLALAVAIGRSAIDPF